MKNKLAKLLPALTLVLTASTFINIAHAQQPTESGSLTADQKVKLQNICQTHQQQLRAVLTPEQQAQIPGAIPDPWNSNNRRQKNINLTSAQQAKIDLIRDTGRSQMNDILTPKQQQQQKEQQQKKNSNNKGKQNSSIAMGRVA